MQNHEVVMTTTQWLRARNRRLNRIRTGSKRRSSGSKCKKQAGEAGRERPASPGCRGSSAFPSPVRAARPINRLEEGLGGAAARRPPRGSIRSRDTRSPLSRFQADRRGGASPQRAGEGLDLLAGFLELSERSRVGDAEVRPLTEGRPVHDRDARLLEQLGDEILVRPDHLARRRRLADRPGEKKKEERRKEGEKERGREGGGKEERGGGEGRRGRGERRRGRREEKGEGEKGGGGGRREEKGRRRGRGRGGGGGGRRRREGGGPRHLNAPVKVWIFLQAFSSSASEVA